MRLPCCPRSLSNLETPQWITCLQAETSYLQRAGRPLIGGFRRELAPAAVLALTERELILITEERRHWFESKKEPKYAKIVTYVPLARLAQHRINRHPKFCLLELETHVSHGGETFEIMLPLELEGKVAECMERATTLMAPTHGRDDHEVAPANESSLGS